MRPMLAEEELMMAVPRDPQGKKEKKHGNLPALSSRQEGRGSYRRAGRGREKRGGGGEAGPSLSVGGGKAPGRGRG